MTETEINSNQDNLETCINGILCGDVSSLHHNYKERIRKMGGPVLPVNDFWNRFRRCFPGTYWAFENYGAGHQTCVGRAVRVMLRCEDTFLASQLDSWGWFTSGGRGAVIETFIQEQENFSGEPHPKDLPIRTGEIGPHVDVMPFQIRTANRENYELAIHPDDLDDGLFWFLTEVGRDHLMHGAILGKDAKQQEWWCDSTGENPPAYIVPKSALLDPNLARREGLNRLASRAFALKA